MKKLTQKQIAFRYLYYNRNRWLMPWEFIGELTINGRHYFGSYKMPTRLSDVFKDLPVILDRKKIKGVSGAYYYAYMLVNTWAVPSFIAKGGQYHDAVLNE